MTCQQDHFLFPDFEKQFPFLNNNPDFETTFSSGYYNFNSYNFPLLSIREILEDMEMVVSSKYNSNFEIITTAVPEEDHRNVSQFFKNDKEPLIVVEKTRDDLHYLIILPQSQNDEYELLREQVLDCCQENHFFNVVISLDRFSLQTKEDYHWRVKLPLVPVQHSITRQLELSKTRSLLELSKWVSQEFYELYEKIHNYEKPDYSPYHACATM